MEELNKKLDFVLFSFSGQEITVAALLSVPLVLIVGFLLTRWLAAFVSNRMTKKGVTPDLIHLVKRLIYILAIIIVVITALDLINVPLTAFAFVSGAIAIGVGFGAQNIINNFISGWILMWERPIKIGDFLEVDTAKGKVEAINTRSTRIRRTDGAHLLIPNSMLLENTVINWTHVDKLMRTTLIVGVAYGSPVKRVSELLLKATKEQQEVLPEPEPVVVFDDFGDNALKFVIYFWIHASAESDLRVIRSNIRYRIDELFNHEGIVIAFPQRDVHIDGSIALVNAGNPAATPD